ncbi:hypothetical protein TNCV_1684771 [Trichonephila clavipes]|nr:hypothetical protein TNCV_1684771 [Trichonephila clavipes]
MNSHSVEKADGEWEASWLIPMKQLLGMSDLVWEVVHFISYYFEDGAVRIACLSRRATRTLLPTNFDVCNCASTAVLTESAGTGVT